jgi:uncharacterized repeat protein (TIGR01451 family)
VRQEKGETGQEEGEALRRALQEGEEVMFRSHRSIVPGFIGAWVAALACGSVLAQGAGASPNTPEAGWELTARTFPTHIAPGETGFIKIEVFNVGAADSHGSVTVTDTLPPGVTATDAGNSHFISKIDHSLWECTGTTVVTCTNNPEKMPSISGGAGGSAGEGPNFTPQVGIEVKVAPGFSGTEANHVTIAGGGAPTPASTVDPITISSTPPGFAFVGWDAWFSNADGTFDTQAGSHPYSATFSFDLANVPTESPQLFDPAGGTVRDIEVRLPPGLVGDPYAVSQCTRQLLDTEGGCPPASQVGFIDNTVIEGSFQDRKQVFNMVPPAGVPAELGFTINGINVLLDVGVRSGSDYGLTTHINDTPQREVLASVLTLWGVPGDASHNRWRDAVQDGCRKEEEGTPNCPSPGGSPKPFLTLPTSCTGPQVFSIQADTWENPDVTSGLSFESHDSNGVPTGLTGCEHLGFGPLMSVAPDTSQADTPTGLTVDVKPPVGGLLDPQGLGTSDIQNTTVTLPEGLVINPGQAAGLEACQESEAHVHDEGIAPTCPLKSKVGTDEAELPILKSALKGNVYVMQSNPPELKLLIVASGDGVEVKLVAHVHLDEKTGRLTTTLEGTPQAPVSDFRLSFSGGAQAALATPTTCGTYQATADFTSWANPFIVDAFPTGAFVVTGGANGAPCPSSPLPFTPSLIAGSTTDQAGGFTAFSLLLQAPDDQQRIEKLQFKIPQGLLGMISRVPLCAEPQAQDGTCSSASQIGHTVVASGPGPYPLVVPQPGQPPAAIYLTGPYKGAPYGLSIVVPVVVGPFTLDTQIVRAEIEIDPLTAQITVTTDPLPQVIDGVPTDLRTVNAVIDRPGFMFNPTSCEPMSFSGTAFSAQGSSAPVSSPFQMGSCRSLLFKPNFKVSTAGRTSRKNGASLDVKLTYPTGPLGANQASSQSNIKSVKVDLPKQLPSRLTTLQKACTAATFDANPAACPSASRVGQVMAVTPVLPVPLTGPAYFVSYGGAKFPELVFVLQGYGVTVDVHAETFISKAGITSSTLHRVPDVPISSFELKLPQGPFSALAANGNLCQSTLKMPTAFTAQDGAVIHQSTPIGVTGCAKHKKAAKNSGKHKKKK